VEVSVARRWFKGNLHTHTNNSDGDSPPDVVVSWYRDAGYDFLALTDHDMVTLPDDHRRAAGTMELIHGEEVTAGDIHMNALGIRRAVEPVMRPTEHLTLEANAGNIRAAGAVPSINHPNFRWAVRQTDIQPLGDVALFEIYNAGPEANNALGRPGHLSTEELWDGLLSLGKQMIAIAVDDAHDYTVWGRQHRNPGRAWVHVRADSAREADVLTALEAGDCYASTGVRLDALELRPHEVAIDVAQRSDLAHRTTFVGRGGQTLDVIDGPSPRYRVRGSEGYVRARVEDSDGNRAWTQARLLV
jgi:hypothetical protein